MPVLPLVGSTIVPPGSSSPGPLGRLDHAERDAVFDAAPRIERLELRHDARGARRDDTLQLDDWGVADQLERRGRYLARERHEPLEAATIGAEVPGVNAVEDRKTSSNKGVSSAVYSGDATFFCLRPC